MAAEASSSSVFPEGDSLLRPLAARGWRFRDAADESIQAVLHASPSPSPEALEADLLDTDLRLFGGKALPDRAAATATKRLSYLHGPIVLQVQTAEIKSPSPALVPSFKVWEIPHLRVVLSFLLNYVAWNSIPQLRKLQRK